MPLFSSAKSSEIASADPAPTPPVTPPLPPQHREVLNVPTGNAPISPEPRVLGEADLRTGDTKTDVMAAIKRIRPIEDLKNIGQIPCARQALLSGIAAGFGIGSISYIARRRPKSAANWAVGSFVGISAIMWENCRRARAKELAQMAIIQEKFAHRHVSKLKRRDAPAPADTGSTSSVSVEQSGNPT
ncbi:hypothetical protein NliqN6_1398 [Naganishia liquefaciens]|uniref:Cytochrome c oxidase assembly protein COX20, mitochondrial n=1 Tax=Naganishia liquefaciens TaxID=104408 RepID=A0A8H3TQA9_9TREE|nr:hypothetical protein NliqN6_1398 [Naganishia liquefaciens]